MIGLQFVSEDDVVALHGKVMKRHGGLVGMRDVLSLRSAVDRQINMHYYDSSADIYDLAAALICGIIQNHPFNDGNKRTGLLSGFLLLRRNGIVVNKLPVAEWYAVTVKLAAHEISEQQFANFLGNFHE
jgi:death-on-curing protein